MHLHNHNHPYILLTLLGKAAEKDYWSIVFLISLLRNVVRSVHVRVKPILDSALANKIHPFMINTK